MLLLRFYFVLFEEVCVYISRIVQNLKMKFKKKEIPLLKLSPLFVCFFFFTAV